MSALNVVCLISGGKDSFFSILHCLANGHRVIALANLHPPNHGLSSVEDMDSYMYQTIGHAVIPLYEQALGLPLYRQEISGAAVNKDKCYGPGDTDTTNADETEALVPLLRKVQAHHPDVNAVSTGAILSDYQRTRVESVAIRLGLTPLSYLWQWPHLPPGRPASLLDDMAAVGQDSRIIKVASGGLDDSFLWANVADRRTVARLVNTAQRFGTVEDGAVLGEGGEYETLAVDGPSLLWKRRIVVGESDRTVVPGEAGSASLRIWNAVVETKDVEEHPAQEVRRPSILDEQFTRLVGELDPPPADASLTDDPAQLSLASSRTNTATDHQLFSNVTGHGQTATEQMRSIMEQLTDLSRNAGHRMEDLAYTSVILRDMTDFPAINTVYGSYFTQPNPPARVTIACASVLPPGKVLMMSATLAGGNDTGSRKGLHVQSRSYWAPANIGPYSQAITVPLKLNSEGGEQLMYIAGQIPLVPASMELPNPSTYSEESQSLEARTAEEAVEQRFKFQVGLSMQHFHRIGRAIGVQGWNSTLAFVVADSDQDAHWKAKIIRLGWKLFHNRAGPTREESSEGSDSEGFDVWDVKYGHQQSHVPQTQFHKRVGEYTQHVTPDLHVVRVDGLPRGSSIEWVTYGLAGSVQGVVHVPHLQHLLEIFAGNTMF